MTRTARSPSSRKGHKNNKKPTFTKKKKKEITFDPEARREYLRGFSERKKQRRAFGLAMQKMKDRKSKLEDRKETREADLERIEQAEQQKQSLLAEMHGLGEHEEEDGEDRSVEDPERTTTTTYHDDTATLSQFGGQVVVTTTTLPNSDDDESDEEESPAKQRHSIDAQQRYAGNVNRFMQKLKGNLPGKRKDRTNHTKHKGRHGASAMSGMGGASNLKLAQKALFKSQAKQTQASGVGGKRKRGKHRR